MLNNAKVCFAALRPLPTIANRLAANRIAKYTANVTATARVRSRLPKYAMIGLSR